MRAKLPIVFQSISLALDFDFAKSVQRAISVTSGYLVQITSSTFAVYSLVSPLWTKLYVGAVGFCGTSSVLACYTKHLRLAKLGPHYRSGGFLRASTSLYSPLAVVGLGNVITVVFCECSLQNLVQKERYFIRKMFPVLNKAGCPVSSKVVKSRKR